MVVYLLMVLVLSFVSFIFKDTSTKRNKIIYLLIIWLVLSLVEGMRAYDVGKDTLSYVTEFVSQNFNEAEPLSRLTFYGIYTFSKSPTVFLLIVSGAVNALILIGIYRDSESPKFSVFLFVAMLFYFVSFNLIKQSIAYSLVFNGFISIKKKKLVSSIIFLLLAIGFHSSAIISLVLLSLLLVKNTKKTKETLFGRVDIAILLSMLAVIIFTLMFWDKTIEVLLKLLPTYEKYFVGDYDYFSKIGGGVNRIIVYSLFLLLFVTCCKSSFEKTIYLFPLSICVVLAIFSFRIAYVERFMYYFDLTIILSIPYLFKNFSINCFKNGKKLFFGITTIAVIFYFIYMLSSGFMGVTNYNFI